MSLQNAQLRSSIWTEIGHVMVLGGLSPNSPKHLQIGVFVCKFGLGEMYHAPLILTSHPLILNENTIMSLNETNHSIHPIFRNF